VKWQRGVGVFDDGRDMGSGSCWVGVVSFERGGQGGSNGTSLRVIVSVLGEFDIVLCQKCKFCKNTKKKKKKKSIFFFKKVHSTRKIGNVRH
jgi:hypothetical protein